MSKNNRANQVKESDRQESKAISRSAFKVSAGNFLGLVAGLLSQMIIAYLFGAGQDMDAFLTAMTVPAYLQAVLLVSLSYVVIPIFVEQISSGQDEEAWALVGTIFWILGALLIPITIAISFFAPAVIGVLAPDLTADKAALASQMLSVMVFVLPISAFTVFSASIQNAQNQFFWPSARTALNSIGNIVTLLALYPWLGVQALAYGFLAAALFETSVTTVPVLRHGWQRTLSLTDARVLEVLKLTAPLVLIGVLTRVTPVFERFFASGLPDGSLSYLGYTAKIGRIFQGVFGSTVATAIFPVMAKAFTKDGVTGLARNFKYGFRLIMALSLPALMLGSCVAAPLITLLFERGAFTHETTIRLAQILPIELTRAGLLFMFGNLVTRSFYVTKDTRTVPVISAISAVLYIGIANIFVRYWGYVGLALADLIYGGLGALVLAAILIKRYDLVRWSELAKYLWRYLAPSGAAFILTQMLLMVIAASPALVQLITASFVFVLVYMVLLFWLDGEIAIATFEVLGIAKLAKFWPIQQFLNRIKLFMPRQVNETR